MIEIYPNTTVTKIQDNFIIYSNTAVITSHMTLQQNVISINDTIDWDYFGVK